MEKYLAILKAQTAIYFVYRLSFFLWRMRTFLNFIIIYFLWNSVYSYKATLFSYTEELMLTYVLLVSVVSAVILSTRTTDIATDIVSGAIMNSILKPVSFMKSTIVREVVDKMINAGFAIVEISLFILLIKPPFFIQTDFLTYGGILIALVIGAIISYSISLSLSLLAFWSAETWAPRFIYFILVSILAGTAFPLDILPAHIYNIFIFTPFPYLVYLPVKMYLTGITSQTLYLLLIGSAWAGILFFMTRAVWNKGLKEFSFQGR